VLVGCQTPKLNRDECNALLRFAFLLRDREYFFAAIVSAMRADVMRQARLVAIGAGGEMRLRHCQMTASAVAPTFGKFSFR
jgi:hypothetical protein